MGQLPYKVCVCVTFTRISNTSGDATLLLPNFWILNAAIFMLAAGREKTQLQSYCRVNEPVCVVHRHVWYLCTDIHQTSLCVCVCVCCLTCSHSQKKSLSACLLLCLGPRGRLRILPWRMFTEPIKSNVSIMGDINETRRFTEEELDRWKGDLRIRKWQKGHSWREKFW